MNINLKVKYIGNCSLLIMNIYYDKIFRKMDYGEGVFYISTTFQYYLGKPILIYE